MKLAYQTVSEKQNTTKIIEKYKTASSDVGSSEVQVALITDRINHLTSHLKSNKKDFSTQRGLLKLVGQRKRLLKYLRTTKPQAYLKLIQSLDLRK